LATRFPRNRTSIHHDDVCCVRLIPKYRRINHSCFIDYVPKMVLPKPIWVSPTDSMTLDSDSASLMTPSLNTCWFPCPTRHLQLHPNFPNTRVKVSLFHRTFVRCCHIIVTLLLGGHSERKDIVHDHGVCHGSHEHGSRPQLLQPVPGGAAVPLCAGPTSNTSRWCGGTGACSGRTSRWACRAFQVFLLCLVYLLLEGGDALDAQSFLTKTPYGIGTVGLRYCG
jgi:hypothetical protein